jgi:hypothetical protein
VFTGLVESYPDAGGNLENQAFTYDQALAGMVMLNQNSDAGMAGAKAILDFYRAQWDGTGFYTVYNSATSQGPWLEDRKEMGANAWIGLFCVQYYLATGNSNAFDLARKIAKWIQTLPSRNGARAMGVNNPSDPKNPGVLFSVENNLDYYALLTNLNKVLPATDPDKASFQAEAASIKSWLKNDAYNSATGLFRRGVNANPDTALTLDTNTWALLVLGPDVLQNEFGINVGDFVGRIESTFSVKNDGTFGGANFTACPTCLSQSKGFDFSDQANVTAIGGLRRGTAWVEGTQHMIAVYKQLSDYYAAKGDSVSATKYADRKAHFIDLNSSYSMASIEGVYGLRHTDSTARVQIFAGTGDVLTATGVSAAATAWAYFSQNDQNPFLNLGNYPNTFVDAIYSFQSSVQSSPNSVLINDILVSAFSVNMLDGISGREAIRMQNNGILYDATRAFRPQPILPLESVADFIVTIQDPLNSQNRPAIESILQSAFGLNISDGIDSSEYNALMTRGIIYDSMGDIKSSPIEPIQAVVDLQKAIAQKSPAEQQLINSALQNQGINLSDGITATEFDALMNKGIIYGDSGQLNTNPANLLLETSQNSAAYTALHTFLMASANATSKAAFEALFGVDLDATDSISQQAVTIVINSLIGDPNYNQTSLTAALPKAGGLLTTLRASADKLNTFNKLFGTTLPLTGNLAASGRKALFDVVGDPAYSAATFSTALDLLKGLFDNLQGAPNDSQRIAFNALFGVTIPQIGSLLAASSSERSAVFGVVLSSGYSQADFLTALPKAKALLDYLRISANDAHRQIFNNFFSVSIDGAIPSSADRGALFDNAASLVDDESNGYTDEIQAFINSLSRNTSLDDLLRADTSLKNAFEALYNVDLDATDAASKQAVQDAINLVTSDPGYHENDFVIALEKAGALLNDLRLNAA